MNTILKGTGGSPDEVVPFYAINLQPGETCGYRGVTARITYRLCNENDVGRITLNMTESLMFYDGIDVDFPMKVPIDPMTCRKKELDRKWDLCHVNVNGPGQRSVGLGVQLNGRVDVPGNDNHCYCKYSIL